MAKRTRLKPIAATGRVEPLVALLRIRAVLRQAVDAKGRLEHRLPLLDPKDGLLIADLSSLIPIVHRLPASRKRARAELHRDFAASRRQLAEQARSDEARRRLEDEADRHDALADELPDESIYPNQAVEQTNIAVTNDREEFASFLVLTLRASGAKCSDVEACKAAKMLTVENALDLGLFAPEFDVAVEFLRARGVEPTALLAARGGDRTPKNIAEALSGVESGIAVAKSSESSPSVAVPEPIADVERYFYLVTLDQAGAVAGIPKRTLERLKAAGKLPAPERVGGGGRPSKWDWATLRIALEPISNRKLPIRFPRDDGSAT